ncbi:hypothetical protein FRC17_007429 [Serendipita sp. 399]|nr:hypothetical protein FRC17_007429 [Serendipita sp. 399]
MFTWYRDSHICIVYLGATNNCVDMRQDPWFSRGWTLQELLAPKRFAFYSSYWMQITNGDSTRHPVELEREKEEYGEKYWHEGGSTKKTQEEASETFLWATIADVTGIDIEDLLNFKPGLYDVGKRMGWASKRVTTRIEDMAYCLIGIFGVNLSIAYGEKERAFYRLQVEILQNSNSKALFDWQGDASNYNSMLAASPACFSKRLNLQANEFPTSNRDPTTLTSAGIRICLEVCNKVPQQWNQPGATAFSNLGGSSKPGYRVILVLERIKKTYLQYKRVALIEVRSSYLPNETSSSAVFIQ